MTSSRRTFLGAAGIGLLAYRVDGADVLLSPRDARERRLPLRVLTAEEAGAIEVLGEGLLPGARDAGLVPFIDSHLAAPPADSLLMLRYLDVPPPYVDFYRPAIAAANAYSQRRFRVALTGLSDAQVAEFIGEISREQPDGWQGPPARLFYFVLRNDAVDAVYGTPDGFERLGLPYMAHIMPRSSW